jgi:hypothetical protein
VVRSCPSMCPILPACVIDAPAPCAGTGTVKRMLRSSTSALVAEDAAVRVARCCTFVARRGFGGIRRSRLTDAIPGLSCEFRRERATGIEPAFSAWEADVLPLNYARENPANLHAGQTPPSGGGVSTMRHGEIPVPQREGPWAHPGSGGFRPARLGHPTGVAAGVRRPDANYAQVGLPHYPLGRI